MNNKFIIRFLLFLVVIGLSYNASATTWLPKDVICPICQTSNRFQSIASYGSYIYNWPSKSQYIFWPLTDNKVLYSCKKCYLTCYMWDFEKIPTVKKEAVKKLLSGISIAQPNDDYTKVPVVERLRIAEKVYSVLDKNDEFWCRFYRVMGYHLQWSKKQKDADEARKKALVFVGKMLAQEENTNIKKELLLISGAMHYFLKNNKNALNNFKEALKLKYRDEKIKKEEAENKDKYLSNLLNEYIEKIQSPKKSNKPSHKS